MDQTDFKKGIRELCERRPDFRKKLAAELKKTADIYDDYMSWEALHRMADQAPKLLELLQKNGEDLEDWQEFKILTAAEYIDAVYDSFVYGVDEDEDEGEPEPEPEESED